MGKPVQIEYIPMPEVLRDKYQYFTQAQMRKLYAAGCPVRFKSLEESVSDYVKQHLEKSIPYLRAVD
jgi:ADP-L-glycero-D-manno-heptose 6-epimerase